MIDPFLLLFSGRGAGVVGSNDRGDNKGSQRGLEESKDVEENKGSEGDKESEGNKGSEGNKEEEQNKGSGLSTSAEEEVKKAFQASTICGEASKETTLSQEVIDIRKKTCNLKSVEDVSPNSPKNPQNVKNVEKILGDQYGKLKKDKEEDDKEDVDDENKDDKGKKDNEAQKMFENLFPLSKDKNVYTYSNFLKAIALFPSICSNDVSSDKEKVLDVCRHVLAAMFAHFEHETGSLTKAVEKKDHRDIYCNEKAWRKDAYPCAKGEDEYYGRGALQLSWNYNYGPFSKAMFGDPMILLNNPDWVATTWLNFAAAMWYFVIPQPPKPSMLEVLDGSWKPNTKQESRKHSPGFGLTTAIINGACECGSNPHEANAQNERAEHYKKFAKKLGYDFKKDKDKKKKNKKDKDDNKEDIEHNKDDKDENKKDKDDNQKDNENEELYCKDMSLFPMEEDCGKESEEKKYDDDERKLYWEWDCWAKDCKLVTYQTAYSALVEGDYAKCKEEKKTNDKNCAQNKDMNPHRFGPEPSIELQPKTPIEQAVDADDSGHNEYDKINIIREERKLCDEVCPRGPFFPLLVVFSSWRMISHIECVCESKCVGEKKCE